MDWDPLIHTLSVIFAIAGGLFSLGGWRARKAEPEGPGESKPVSRSHVLYMVAYLFMSLSIFLFALRGLLFRT